MSRFVKVLTRKQLKELLYKKQQEWGYNRRLSPNYVWREVEPHPESWVYPLLPVMVYEHKAGERAEPHYRCQLAFGSEEGQSGVVDVEMSYYNQLKEMAVPVPEHN